MSRIITIATALAILAASFAVPATATKPAPEHKVTICHGTASETNRWIKLNVDIASSGYVKGGHHKDQGASHGSYHRQGKDIIPPYTYGDFSYPGQNWNSRTQAIWENGCKVPPPPPVVRFKPQANYFVCGDPRVFFVLNNRKSREVSAHYRITFTTAHTREVRTVSKVVPPGVWMRLYPRWVKGRSIVSVTVTPTAGPARVAFPAVVTTLLNERIPRATPWGEGRCPASLASVKRGALIR
jgi:hypothetical protein